MKKSLFLTTLVCGVMWASWSHADVSGTYSLDKKPLIAKIQERIAKLPPNRRGFAGMMIGMLKTMKMDLALANDGRASMSMKMVMFGRPRNRLSLGSWKMSGDAILLRVKAQPNPRSRRRRPPRTQTMRCDIKNGGKRLACVDEGRRRKEVMFFDKVSEQAVIATPTPRATMPTTRTARAMKPVVRVMPRPVAELVEPVVTQGSVDKAQAAAEAAKNAAAEAAKAAAKAAKAASIANEMAVQAAKTAAETAVEAGKAAKAARQAYKNASKAATTATEKAVAAERAIAQAKALAKALAAKKKQKQEKKAAPTAPATRPSK